MKNIALALAGTLLAPLTGSAVTVYGLTASNDLISFDSAAPAAVTTIGAISQAGIQDIDFYPVNGALYGSTSNGNLYQISTVNGTANLVATPSMAITGLTDIDFNPAADRLRIFAAGDSNYRMAPDVFTNNATAAGTTLLDGVWSNSAVNLVGAAYTNNFDGVAAANTTLYSIDSESNGLFIHSDGPQFNTVTLVGPLGIDAGLNVGFDIDQAGNAWLSNGHSFYSLNIATGAAALVGTVGGGAAPAGLVSIAAVAVPEASTVSVLMLTGLAALRRRRRA